MNRNPANRALPVGLVVLLAGATMTATPVLALSEFQGAPAPIAGEQNAAPGDEAEEAAPEERTPLEIPMPDPLVDRTAVELKDDEIAAPDVVEPVEVLTDVSKIPVPVARMRELIVEAAASGDIERLRPLLGKGPTQTQVTATAGEDDPIAALKSLSGDQDGIEILAILLDVMSTGFVLADKGTPEEAYVWPYFAEKPLSSLTAPEKVDLFRLVTAGDFAGMEEFGTYNFYRVGITPDGKWKFFVAGD
ncbi:hypothetical protein CN151_29885 [Sinorhizobium meliloti]|jgi:hypothetical protein|uniref:Alanine and proline-rich secreted protein Apa n=5 Tax=Sinorhizobium TaxID=28105 RepID=Q92KH0_RHIME|nr:MULTISPECIES: hypothetical protein [Sinorhizobium]PST27779.1 hypothetical protein C7U62_08025 [Mesorhizobium loti]TWB02704.1 hypothetical protein FB000_106176 [Ensifer sp. SEMIA 134]TWB36608.1 hypothetical protein FB001_10652 [Ensifer sp. SEMIA 135]AEG52654.1 hypothetical protein Sinme_0901 [Sinorhizobium meliloti AK83]AEH78048.1 hypothetical protein SM11_chr0770 [Sinorhizobium meliloti SM11]